MSSSKKQWPKSIILFITFVLISSIECLIRPQETASRKLKNLDGIWKFKLAPEQGLDPTRENEIQIPSFLTKVNPQDWMHMPVPSSFNDITQNASIRDYVGWYWYKRDFMLHDSFYDKRVDNIYIHFGSVHYHCEVYVNGILIGTHTGGHLPFELQINKKDGPVLALNKTNTLIVIANNILTPHTTIPQGRTYKPQNTTTTIYPKDYMITESAFDFFNYAGIHRSVNLITKPKSFIQEVNIDFSTDDNDVIFNYKIDAVKLSTDMVQVTLINSIDDVVFQIRGASGSQVVLNPDFWWPYTMNNNQPPDLYRVNVRLVAENDGMLIDEVEIRTGIRFIEIVENKLFINRRRAYLTGFGRHEDLDIRGRGLDLAFLVKDFNLIKWIQANSFRTSHYPYSEELMDLADEYGILIIDECPAVSLHNFDESTLEVHKQQLKELIIRDRHHPSVLFWSIANEAESQKSESDNYFAQIVTYVRSLDNSRLITAAINKPFNTCHLSKYLDVIMLNRYYGWYSQTGKTEFIKEQIEHEFDLFYQKYRVPMMISEYGADTVAGLHQSPGRVYSEDYQVEYLRHHYEAFDNMIKKNYFIGEHYWNFADFMTRADYTRVIGNRKGLFTRDRQPKAAAKVMRCRYSQLAARFSSRKFESDYEMYC